ncbi:MAG: DUF455 family protein [Myxococcota bacterium]
MRRFAWRVLTGDRLADKLAPPGADEPPAGRAVPEAPARPDVVRLPAGRVARRVPGPRDLHDAGARGRVLHALADHELQALELFALALLRFGGADPRLRRAWLAALLDEQRHLGLYLQRMAAVGASLGELPMSGFFWRTLQPVADPVRFSVGIGLVFEQANLDFSTWWAAAFREAGDVDTASVLDRVHADEVRHVRLAARALDRARQPGEPQYPAFRRHLAPPLAPARARGGAEAPFDRDGRLRAGLEPAFVDALATSGGGRGPQPRVFVLDPLVEEELAGRPVRAGVREALAADLALLPVVAARPRGRGGGAGAVARVPRRARPRRVRGAAGGADARSRAVAGEARAVWTWGTSPAAAARLAALGVRHDPRTEVLYDKVWAAEQAPRWLDGLDLPWTRRTSAAAASIPPRPRAWPSRSARR